MATDLRVASQSDAGRLGGWGTDVVLTWTAPFGQASPLGLTAVVAIADGLGEPPAAAAAARYVTRRLEQVLTAMTERPQLDGTAELADYLQDTVRWIHETLPQVETSGTGPPSCGLTALLIQGEAYVIGHLGSGRVYRWRDDQLELLTRDHTYTADQVRAGLMTATEAFASPLRGHLTRALGVGEALDLDRLTGDVRPGDRFVVCSDGLVEELDDTAIASVLRACPTADEACQRLLAAASGRGASDHISVAIAQCGPPSEVLSGPSPLQAERREIPLQLETELAPQPRRRRANLRRLVRVGGPVLVLLGLVIGFAAAGGRRDDGPRETVTYPPSTPIATPQPATPTPAPPVAEPLTVALFADGRKIVVATPPSQSGLVLQVSKLADADYQPEAEGEAWTVQLKNPATGQSWRIEGGGDAVADPESGQLSGEPVEVKLLPGRYTLLVAETRPVMQLEVAAKTAQ